jgi:hypothetical protein
MTTTRSARVVRFGRLLAEMWLDIDQAQRRMFEIRIGVRGPTRREYQTPRPDLAGAARRATANSGPAAGLTC